MSKPRRTTPSHQQLLRQAADLAESFGVGMIKIPRAIAHDIADRLDKLETEHTLAAAEIVLNSKFIDDLNAMIERYRDCEGWRTRELANAIRQMCEKSGFHPAADDVWAVAESAYAPLPDEKAPTGHDSDGGNTN